MLSFDIGDAFSELESQRLVLRKKLFDLGFTPDDIFIPAFETTEFYRNYGNQFEARLEYVIDEMTRIYMRQTGIDAAPLFGGDEEQHAPDIHCGIVSIRDRDVLQSIADFNRVKARFKKACLSYQESSKDRLHCDETKQLLDEEFYKTASVASLDKLRQRLRDSGAYSLSLKDAYAKVRVFEHNIHSISYTWGRSQFRVREIPYSAAVDLIKHYINRCPEEFRAQNITEADIINSIPPGKPLAHKTPLPLQLRMNWAYTDGSRKSGLGTRIHVVPKPLDELKFIRWKDKPDENTPLKPSCVTNGRPISKKPLIAQYHLYNYDW